MEGVAPFHRRVYEVARTIPPGKTLAYGDVAARLGAAGAARAVGQALGRNPFPIVVPCHRVLAAGGKIGGFSAHGGIGDETPHAGDRRRAANDARREALGFEPAIAVEHLRARDETLARVIDAVGPFRLQLIGASSIFGALARGDRLPAAERQGGGDDFRAVLRAVSRRGARPPSRSSPHPTDELRGAGLSRSKLLSLRDLAGKTVSGRDPDARRDPAYGRRGDRRAADPVRGIGRWTVEMLLIFRLGRPDVLPVDDYGVRKGFAAPMPRVSCRRARRSKPTASGGSPIGPWRAGICGAWPSRRRCRRSQ